LSGRRTPETSCPVAHYQAIGEALDTVRALPYRLIG